MTKKNFFKRAKFLQKGQVDGDNRFKVKSDCYNVKISELQTAKSKRLIG
jgi:hypothetical protein